MATDFFLKVGDRLPRIQSTLKDGTGAVIDLTGATVTFRMGLGGGEPAKIDTPATIVDAMAGKVEYAWGATDTDTAGNYAAEWVVTISALRETVPNNGYLRVIIGARV